MPGNPPTFPRLACHSGLQERLRDEFGAAAGRFHPESLCCPEFRLCRAVPCILPGVRTPSNGCIPNETDCWCGVQASRKARCSSQEAGSGQAFLSRSGVRDIGCMPSMMVSTMSGARKARLIFKLM